MKTAANHLDHSAPLPSLVLATDWNVSTETSSTFEGAKLRVFKFVGDDLLYEPTLHDMVFQDSTIDGHKIRATELARRMAWGMGLLKVSTYKPTISTYAQHLKEKQNETK